MVGRVGARVDHANQCHRSRFMVAGSADAQKITRRRSPASIRDRWAIAGATIALPFIALVLGPVVIWELGIGLQEVVALVVMYGLTMLGITLGYHRTITHRSLELIPSARYAIVGPCAAIAPSPTIA